MTDNRIANGAGLILLLAVTFWTYRGALDNPFHFDDHLFLQSPQVTDPGDPWYLLRPRQTRQLTYLTFYWNYRSGRSDPKGYHLVNVLLHLTNVLAFYFFARLLFRSRLRSWSAAWQNGVALAAAAFFALHPIQTEPVNYVYQRSTLLAALFMLLSMSSYLKSEQGGGRSLWGVIAGVCFLLGVASKEVALVLPFIWVALVWTEAPDYHEFLRTVTRSRWLTGILITASAIVIWILVNQQRTGEMANGMALLSESFRYFMTQIQVLPAYLRILIYPAGLSVDHDFQPAPFTSVYALLCIVLLVCILAIAAAMRGRRPLAAFLLVAFLIWLSPTSSFVPSEDLMFEHRLYIPTIAFAMISAYVLFSAARVLLKRERLRVVACLAATLLLSGGYVLVSKQRTYTWGTATRLWEDAVAKAPRKARARYNLGISYLETDRLKARQELLRAVELDPNHAAALYNLGWLEQREGAMDSARKYYTLAIQADPSIWQAYHNLGNICILEGELQSAMKEFRTTIRLRPDYWPAHISLARLLLQTGDTQGALETLQNLKQRRWDLLEARFLSAVALAAQKRFAEAEDELKFIDSHDLLGAYDERVSLLRRGFPSQVEGARRQPLDKLQVDR